jgi:hypothetical protein
MPLYRIKAPNGLTYQIEGPEGASQEEVAMAVMAQNPDAGKPFKEAGFSLADTGVAALQSAVGATKSTLQGFGAEAPGVETLSNLQKGLGQLYSPERQVEQARRDALEKAAAKSGSTLEEIKAGAAGVTEAPIQATASAVGSSVPTVALAIGAAALAAPAAAVIGLSGAAALAFAAAVGIGTKYALGALQGAGSVKGSIYDAVKEEVGKQYPDLSKEQVSKIALEAQEFTGKNWDNIMAGTGIGFVAGGTGLEKDLLKKLSKPVAAAAAKEAGEEVAKKGIIAGTKRAAGAGLKEAVPEAIQGGQEQFAANVAQTREGFETPAMEGVLGAATKEGLMGMLGGSAVSPFTGEATAKPPAPVVDQSGQPTPNELEAQVQQRRLAREQEQMGVKQGRAAREGEKLIDAEAKAEADQQQAARVEAEKAAATELQALRAQRQAELEQTFPKDYSDVMQKTDAYATLFQEKQALTNQTQTKEVKARIKTIDGLIQGIIEEDNRVPNEFKRMQAENAKVTKNLPPDLQAKYAATAFTIPEPQQMEIRAATVEQTPVQQTDLLGQPIQQEAPAPATPDKFKTVQTATEAQAALDLQNRRDARAGQAERNAAKDAGQLGLFTRVGTPTDEAAVAEPKIIVKKPPVTEPTVRVKPTPETVAPVITADTLGVLGIGPTAVMRKPGHAIQGLDITKPEDAAEVRNMLSIYKEGRSPAIVQKIDTFLGRPEFQGLPAPAPKVTPTVTKAPVVKAPDTAPVVKAPTKTTGQSAEKKAANKAAQPSAKKVKDETAKSTAKPTSTPTVTKKVEAPATPAPVKVVKKTEPKKVEPKKVEPKKVVKKAEPKKLEAPKVEPKKEEPKVDKALEKARETVDDLDLDPETTKTKVKSFAKRLHKAGLIDDISLNAVESISKDKDMGYEDLLDEIRFALEAYESNQKKAPETKKVTDESNVIEGETRVIPDNQQKLLEGPVGRLQDDQVEELEDFYGVDKSNPEFWKRLQEDVTLFAEKGAKAVKQAIREIIRQVQAGVLAVGVIFNPGNISAPEAFVLHSPVSVTTTQEVKAEIPASVASKMSDGAKEAYEILIPAMKGKNGDKLMVFVDKPTGRIFIFDADGKPVLDKKVLIGLAKGDLYKGNNDLPQNRITPAGLFGIKIIDAAKGGSAKKTAGDYDFGKVFALEDPDAVVTIMHSVWLKEKDAAQRQAALQSESAADSRYSFGCINIDKATYKYLLDNFQAQMDGAKMFVVPDNQADTKAFLTGEKSSGDVLVREAVKPVTKTTTQTRDSAFAQEAKTGALGREQGLPPKEPTRSRITDDQNPVDNPISNAELEGIVDDVKKSLGGEVEVTILDSAKDLDPKAPAGAAGLVKDGNVYLFRDGIKSGIEGAKTVFHELFHLGLQKLLTNPKEYHRVMINLYRMNARVREMADKWIASQEGQDAKAAYAKEYANPNDRLNALTAHGTDEALARIAEELKTGKKIGTGQRAFVRSIAKWLADVAEKIGMRQVAQSIRSATYTEVEKFVQEAMTAAVGAGPVNVRLTRRFAQAATTAFEKWFGDSKAVDKNGNPLVIYRGIIGENEQALNAEPRAGYATFGSDSPQVAASYGNPDLNWNETGAITPLYIKADSLIEFPTSNGKFDKFAFDRRAKTLRPGEVLVARQVYDYGPRANTKVDPAKLYSYPSDVYAWNKGTSVKSATGNVGAYDIKSTDTRYSVRGGIDENTRRAVQAIQDKTPAKYKEPEKKTLVQQLKSVGEVETRDQAKLLLRQKAADKFATVNAKVNQMFSKGFKNAFGDLNPMVLARQAEEARKLVLDFYKAGGIRFTKSGLIETVDTKDSLQGAVEQLVDLASKSDMTYKEAESYVSSLLEGHRLYNMREEHDKPLEASALILEQQGKNKEADAERKKKLARHMDNADVDTLEAAFQKSPETKAILDTLNATRMQAIDLMVKAGRITKEQGQFWKDNAAYVPFDRVFVETESPVKGRGTYGISTLRNLPGMEGSFERPIKNVFDSYTSRLGWMITEAAHNNASYNVLDTMALGGFAKELKPKEVPGNKNLTIKVYREGKPVEFEVESAADYEAFQAAPELTGWLVGSLVPAARWVRVGVTAFPAFSIKQVIEDAQRAMFNSGVERPLVTGMRTLYNFPRLLTSDALQALGVSKKMPLVREMEKLGIIGDYDVNIINPAQDIKIAAGAEKRGWSGNVYHVLEKITKASDLAARLAVFESTLMETGGKRDGDGNITGGDKDLAQLRARELINFSRRGSDPTIRTLSRVVPFMNAYAQGMDVTYRTASGLDAASGSERMEARKQFYKMAMKLTALGFMYTLAFGDDEGYKNATDEVRDNNFLIPHTDKKIPLPKEIGFLFKSIPERLVNYYRRYGTDEEQSILNLLGTIVKGGFSAYGTPNATPAQIKPILENMTNYSFFLQRELESASMQKLDPSQRFTPSTSELAKSIGDFSRTLADAAGTKSLEVSPIKVDNLLRGLFGIAGSSTLLVTDALINPSRPDRPLYQMPFASLFIYNTQGGRAKNEFYDLQEKVGQADATFKSLRETSPEKALDYMEKNEALLAVAPILNSSLKQLSTTRKLRLQLETMSNEQLGMTGKERREAITDIVKQENESLDYIRALDKQVRDLKK